MATRREFAHRLLAEIDAPVTKRTMNALVSWMQGEGGTAAYNPLNTTLPMPGSWDYNWNNGVPVQNYRSLDDGVTATARTLNYGADHGIYGYHLIRKRLRHNKYAYWTLRAVELSAWGTGGVALRCLRWVKRRFAFYADQTIG